MNQVSIRYNYLQRRGVSERFVPRRYEVFLAEAADEFALAGWWFRIVVILGRQCNRKQGHEYDEDLHIVWCLSSLNAAIK